MPTTDGRKQNRLSQLSVALLLAFQLSQCVLPFFLSSFQFTIRQREKLLASRVVTDVLRLLPGEKVKLQLSRKINRLSWAPSVVEPAAGSGRHPEGRDAEVEA